MEDIDDHVIVLKDLFKKFTLAHNSYHETLTQETDMDESDYYFFEKQSCYISVLDLVNLLVSYLDEILRHTNTAVLHSVNWIKR